MTVMDTYNERIKAHDIEDDTEQRALLEPLNALVEALNAQRSRWRRSLAMLGMTSWLGMTSSLQGFYLFGPVGVGKTFLLDLLYEGVTSLKKKRFHFYHFMQHVDAELRKLQGKKNPLVRIAKDIRESTDLLCIDEFMVEDVANAMILGELLPLLLAQGLVLVTTSNILPDDLYRFGSHRVRFLPAIAAIKSHCQIACLNIQKDYRLGRGQMRGAYLFPLGDATDKELANQYAMMLPSGQIANPREKKNLQIQRRDVPCVAYEGRVVWFDFKTICAVPRSQLDYLEIAERFDAVFLSQVPQLGEKDTVGAILLIHLIDVMYDRGIRLIISAEVAIEKLYLLGELTEEFKRTASRLQEMQSADYLKRHPKRL